MASLTLRDVSKSFGAVDVLRNISLQVEHGEFLTLLGPSGCGKSTLLRIIAGLEQQTSGAVLIADRVVDRWRPKDRDVAMVFQSYALYPHLTVAANLALPLQMRRMSAAQRLPLLGRFLPGARAANASISKDVCDVAKALELGHLLDRKPGQLSGGQRQRVALARAMVRHPAVFLMDEPLSNLDAKLRAQMRAEIADLRNKIDTTFVYVTHDQTEAMTMSDRVAVMFDGEIEQLGTPHLIYTQPATRRVAEFIGSPRINLLDGIVRPRLLIEAANLEFPVGVDLPAGTPVTLGIRPEALHLVDHPGPGVISGRIQRLEYLGSDLLIHFHVLSDPKALVLRTSPKQAGSLRIDDPIRVAADCGHVLVFNRDGQAGGAVIPIVAQRRNHRRS